MLQNDDEKELDNRVMSENEYTTSACWKFCPQREMQLESLERKLWTFVNSFLFLRQQDKDTAAFLILVRCISE